MFYIVQYYLSDGALYSRE